MQNLYWIKDKQGNKIPFKPNWAQKELLACDHPCQICLKARQLGMCLDPETKVLKADLSWEKIRDLKPGDEIVSVDEHPPATHKGRRLRKGVVEGVIFLKRSTYRITFDNGKSLICTGKHPWLSAKANVGWKWRTIEDEDKKRRLKVGTKIRRIVDDTWTEGEFEDGWIGGMLDGEGSISNENRAGIQVTLSQLPGTVFDRMYNYFKSNGYNFRIEDDNATRKTKYGKTPVPKIALTRIDEVMKLISVTKPSRFRKDWWVGKELPSVGRKPYSTITKIEYLGEQEVVDLQTSEGTYVAEGYVSHNTTFYSLYLLDAVLWNENTQAGIVAQTLDDTSWIFKERLKYAFDHLHPAIRSLFRCVSDSTKELRFTHGSSIRVGTSLRGSTLQLLHISELGKISIRTPEKAREIKTGALQTIAPGQKCFIESTAEGSTGLFHEMVMKAYEDQKQGKVLGPMDFKLFFFPWFRHKSEYTL